MQQIMNTAKGTLCFFIRIQGKKMATPQGFEPRLNEPKSFVLPLHHRVASLHNLLHFLKKSNIESDFFKAFCKFELVNS